MRGVPVPAEWTMRKNELRVVLLKDVRQGTSYAGLIPGACAVPAGSCDVGLTEKKHVDCPQRRSRKREFATANLSERNARPRRQTIPGAALAIGGAHDRNVEASLCA